MYTAKSNIENRSIYLSFLMNDKSDTIYQPSDGLIYNIGLLTVYKVSGNRSDIRAMQLATAWHRTMNKVEKNCVFI